MRVITKSNFDFKLNEIQSAIKNAHLVAIKVQSSSIVPDLITEPNSFASPVQLYKHIRRHIKKFIVLQIGLTTFTYNSETKKYTACCYVFYAYPRSIGSVKREFVLDSSTVEYLAECDFDLDLVVYKGINYLNQGEQEILQMDISSGALLKPGDRGLTMEEEDKIGRICTKVSMWETTAQEKQAMTLNNIDQTNALFVYVLSAEIRRRFHTLWTHQEQRNKIVVTRVAELERTSLEMEDVKLKRYEEKVMSNYTGLSRLFTLLTELRRPIIACSPLDEMMLLYQEFHKPLPACYQTFKSELNELFPHIYDMQHLAYELQANHDTGSKELDILRSYFQREQGAKLAQSEPPIELSPLTNNSVDTIIQEPGWVSYYNGSSFIRVAHFLAKANGYDGSQVAAAELVSSTLSAGAKKHKNRLHVAPANVTHICLDGEDPAPSSAQYLHISYTLCHPAHLVIKDLDFYTRRSLVVDMVNPRLARVLVNSRAAAAAIAQRYDLNVTVEERPRFEKLTMIGTIGTAVTVTALGLWICKRSTRW